MQGKRIAKTVLIIAILIITAVLGFKLYEKIKYENSMATGDEYMEKQEEYIQNFSTFYSTLDDVVIMGITNGVGDPQYRIAVEACTESLVIMEEDYNSYIIEHPLRHETVNEFQVDALNAVYEMFISTHYLMYSMYEGFSSEDELVYTYLMYKQSITNSLDIYRKARDMDQRMIR